MMSRFGRKCAQESRSFLRSGCVKKIRYFDINIFYHELVHEQVIADFILEFSLLLEIILIILHVNRFHSHIVGFGVYFFTWPD